jgi:hypothetical protein
MVTGRDQGRWRHQGLSRGAGRRPKRYHYNPGTFRKFRVALGFTGKGGSIEL